MAEVDIRSRPDLRQPIMVSGFPGIGRVAWLAAKYLVRALKANLFAEVYSDAFYPRVFIDDDGVVKVTKGDLHCWRNPDGASDLVIFTADEQPYSPEGQYELAQKILDFGKQLRLSRLITLAGSGTQQPVENPKVYAAVTDQSLVKELESYGINGFSRSGVIGGLNGLLFGLAKLRELPAVCLLAETVSAEDYLDMKGTQALLEVLKKVLGVSFDMSGLQQQVKEAEQYSEETSEEEAKTKDKELRYVR